MKFRCAALLATLAAAPALFAAEPRIEFSGVLTADGKTRIALTDLSNNATTWVEAGDVFNGYTVVRYDPKDGAVFVRKDGTETRLGLALPKSAEPDRPARPALSGTPTPSVAQPPGPAPATSPIAQAPVVPPPVPPISPSPSNANAGGPPAASSPPASAVNPATPGSTTAPGATTAAATPPPPIEPLPPTGRQTTSPTYTVQGGDTVDSIALTQGVTPQQIRELNPTLNSTSLRAGETIRIR